jgi:hypothetical protein
MKTQAWLLVLWVVGVAVTAWGQEPGQVSVRGSGGEVSAAVEPIVVEGGETGVKKVVHTFDRPGLMPGMYMLAVRARATGTGDTVGLTTWNTFDGKAYFSRSERGVPVSPDGDWRVVQIPFVPGDKVPEQVSLEVEVPAGVRLEVSGLLLSSAGNAGMGGGWWSVRDGAWLGAIAGSAIGLVGALLGVLRSRGRAMRLCVVLAAGVMGVGVVFLGLGVAALVAKQPYHVFYPPLLVGLIATVVMGGLLPTLRRATLEQEHRRMQAVDV